MGANDFTLDLPGGCNVSVFGDNGTGKTRLFTAFCWLLFGKDSQNRKEFQIKTLDENNQPVHNLEHGVTGLFAVGLQTVTFKKIFHEVWTKKRGSATDTFTGHTTEYFIDGVPKQQKEYEARIASILDEKTFRLLSDPACFSVQMKWEDRRRLLLEVCGDVSDADVIASNSVLAKLPAILKGQSVEDHRKIVKARQTELNKELEKIPVRIAEVQRGIPELTTANTREEVQAALKRAQTAAQEKRSELTRIEAGGGAAEKESQIILYNSKIAELRSAAKRKADDATHPKRQELRDVENAVFTLDGNLRTARDQAKSAEVLLSGQEADLEALRQKLFGIEDEAFAYTSETVCPTCNQTLPADQVEAAIAKAQADFNLGKANRLETTRRAGKELKTRSDTTRGILTELQKTIAAYEAELLAKREQAIQLHTDWSNATSQVVPDSPGVLAMLNEQAALAKSIEEARGNSSSAIEKINREIVEADAAVSSLQKEVSLFSQFDDANKRIVDLSADEKRLASEYEVLQSQVYLTEQFVTSKVKLLEAKINSRFAQARFKPFEEQVNGGVSECCEVLYNGVPYGSNLNSGARINVGLDIINTLSRHYAVQVPVWVDNAESVTALTPMEAQMVRLVVSKPDQVLRIEKEV